MFGDTSFCCISKWNWNDEYSISGRIQKCGEGGKGAWVLSSRSRGPNSEDRVGAGARERKDTWSRGSREGVGAGARTRKMESEPGLERGRTLGAGGPNSEDGVGAGAREKIDAVRNMSMKRRRD